MIEFAKHFSPRRIQHVLMDWDGTLSLVRAGWQEIMAGVFVENMPPLPGETAEHLANIAGHELMELNGKPSIHQMTRLAELVKQRAGKPAPAVFYQGIYQKRVGACVHMRLDAVRKGRRKPESQLVPGARAMLAELQSRDVPITLASGTPMMELMMEVELLAVDGFFRRIAGPNGLEDKYFSKKNIIEEIAGKERGAELLAFGDGPVEISETKAVGGLAVGVATDENAPGKLDPRKRDALLEAGADAIITDFRNPSSLLQILCA